MTPLTTTAPKIMVTKAVNANKKQIWNALTSVSEMKEWYFDCIEGFKADVGFETKFLVASGDKTFTHLWKVTDVVPYDKIIYSWQYEEYPGLSASTFDIIDTADGFSVRVTCDILEDFPNDISEFTVKSCTNGWEYFMGRLALYLDNK